MTLESIRSKAQQDANRTNRSLVILNLNRYSPLYVVRDIPEDQRAALKNLVEVVNPNA